MGRDQLRYAYRFHDEDIISQFEGYAELEEFDWEGYRRKYGHIHRLDRILEAEHDTPNRYKVSKQADVLMLFYLFSTEELSALFAPSGYKFDPAMIPRNIDYYLARTSDGSTLSTTVRAWLLARANREGSWELFNEALQADVADVQGGTTPEGIHLGAMAGTVDIVYGGYTGIEPGDGILWLNPRLPGPGHHLELQLRYRSHWLSLSIRQDRMNTAFEKGPGPEQVAKVGFRDQVYEFRMGEKREFSLAPQEQGIVLRVAREQPR